MTVTQKKEVVLTGSGEKRSRFGAKGKGFKTTRRGGAIIRLSNLLPNHSRLSISQKWDNLE